MRPVDEHDLPSEGAVSAAAPAAPMARSVPVAADAEEPFRTLVENIPGVATYLDRVIVEDPGHSIPLYISPQIEQILGYPLSEWLDESEIGSGSCIPKTGTV